MSSPCRDGNVAAASPLYAGRRLPDRLSRIKSMSRATLGFDDRDDLSFGNDVVEVDQN